LKKANLTPFPSKRCDFSFGEFGLQQKNISPILMYGKKNLHGKKLYKWLKYASLRVVAR
jgi:hypothetical protein